MARLLELELPAEARPRVSPHEHLELARLGYQCELLAPEAHRLGTEHELDPRRLARLEPDATKSFELARRAGHRTDQASQVELHHLVPRQRATVAHRNGYGDRL